MVPIKGEWTPFRDLDDQLNHHRLWGLIPPKSDKLRPVMVVDGYFGIPEPCKVVGYQGDNWAVIELADGYHAIHGEYLTELQPQAQQKLPYGVCFAEILSHYVVVDIETTGFDFHQDRIIEIAAISYEYGTKISEYHTLVNPEMLIPERITKLTGITQADVMEAPTLDEIENRFLDFIGDMPIIGHNALTFDVPFLSAQLSHRIHNYVFDTLLLSRKVFDILPRHKLEYLNGVLHLESAGSHRALNDVETTNALLWACLAPRKYEAYVFRAFLDHRLSGNNAKPKRDIIKPIRSAKERSILPSPKRHYVDIKSITPTCDFFDQSHPLCGKNIVFTGELSIPREEAMQMSVNSGAILKTSVSGKTAYLVVGKQEFSNMGTKEKKARELNSAGKANIQILNESEFLQLVKKEGVFI